MIYIYGLLGGLFEVQRLTESRAWHWDVAQQRWLESMKEAQDNVIYVDFKASRETKEDT
ncbi:hypothetical protein [Bradyrhizobium sp. ARR65]|uniref:hypothetical protein n=1 Tax=Bradyrhizobium sp. ARR65 TaxID=1040989 RepID=UPI000A7693A2|nr:hypothetical protein [Bradyrhizobium sp. ARR65]